MSKPDELSDVWARLSLDREVCIGVGQCEMLAPDVFRLDDDDGVSAFVGSPWLPQARAELLADKCPSGAITVAESGARRPARPTQAYRPTAPAD